MRRLPKPEMAALLGLRDEQLQLDWVAAGEGEAFVEKVRAFVEKLQ